MSSKSILWDGTRPSWNVTAVTAYPVEIQSTTVYVYLSPYSSDELKEILKQAIAGYRRDKRDTEITREDKKIYAPLCDAHFVKLGNATGTPEQQRQWLEAHPEVKPSFVELTFAGLLNDAPTEEDVDTETGIFDITAEMSGKVDVYQSLYDPETKKVVRVDMTHFYTHPNEAQYREFRAARRNRFIQKKSMWTIVENHTQLEKLYDATIQSISGMSVNGKPCDAETKAEWISSVPLWHKLAVVDHIFAELVAKNV